MSRKYEPKTHLNFAASNMIREQKSSDGSRAFEVRHRIDELYGEINKKDAFITHLNANGNEWREKNEELVRENSRLRAQLTQYYGEDLNLAKQKHDMEIQGYINEIQKYRTLLLKYEEEFKSLKLQLSDLDDYKEKILQLEESLLDIEKENEGLNEITFLKDKTIQDLNKHIEELSKKDNSTSEIALRIKEDLIRKVNEYEAIIRDLSIKIEGITNESQESLKAKALEINKLMEENTIYEERRSALVIVVANRDSMIAVLSSEGRAQNNKIVELERLISVSSTNNSTLSSDYNLLRVQNEKLKKDYESLQDSHKNCEFEKVSYVNYEKIERSLIEYKEKYENIRNLYINLKENLKTIIERMQADLFSSIVPLNLEPLLQSDSILPIFLEFTHQISLMISKNQSLLSSLTVLEQKLIESTTQLSKLQLENSTLIEKLSSAPKITPNISEYEQKLQLYKDKLEYEIEVSDNKSSKIQQQKSKIEKLQQEIKSSFLKIDSLKSQLEFHDKNILTIEELQELNESYSSQIFVLQGDLDRSKKRILQLESEPRKKHMDLSSNKGESDINAVLLQRIELMKCELEQYNPSASRTEQELKTCKSVVSEVYFCSNKLEFTLKCLEEDFKCKVCTKLENMEIYACGHVNCIMCNKVCKDCSAPAEKLGTHIFYSLNRRLIDMKKTLQSLKVHST